MPLQLDAKILHRPNNAVGRLQELAVETKNEVRIQQGEITPAKGTFRARDKDPHQKFWIGSETCAHSPFGAL
jgi:hypothetical protein